MAFTKSVREVIDEDKTGLLAKHESWERVLLQDVAVILNGFPFESALFNESKGFPLIRIRDVVSGSTNTYYTGIYKEEAIVRHGDLIVGMDGDFNSAFWQSDPGLLNQRVCKIEPNKDFYSKKLLGYALPGYLKAINSNTPSVTVKHLSSKTIGEIELPLPPLAEQIRIVEKLEEAFSDLDVGVAELKAVQKKLAQYRQSLLKAAVEGTLTAEWRKARAKHGEPLETGAQLLKRILIERRHRWEEKQLAKFAEQNKTPPKDWKDKYPEPVPPDTSELPKLPKGWTWASLDMLGEIVSGVAKGMKRDPKIPVREVPYLRVANVQRGYLDLREIKTILATEGDIEYLTLQIGDVLFNEGGDRDKLGRGWVWRGEIATCIHQNHVFRLRPYLSGNLPELISHHGNTFGQKWFQTAGTQTTNLASINMGVLRLFPVPIASVEEQREILKLLNTQMEVLDHQEKAVELGLKQAETQRKNILKAAFSGQLVAQDPNDEPASVLLERIRAEREELAQQPKLRKAKVNKQEVQILMKKLVDVLAEEGDWITAEEAFRRCGVADGTSTERIEELYAELRELIKATPVRVEVEREENSDKLKLIAKAA